MNSKKKWFNTWKGLCLFVIPMSVIFLVSVLWARMEVNEAASRSDLDLYYRAWIPCVLELIGITVLLVGYLLNSSYLIKKDPAKKIRRFWIGFLPVIIALIGSWWIVLFFKG